MATGPGPVTFRWYLETGPESGGFARARSAALLRAAYVLAGGAASFWNPRTRVLNAAAILGQSPVPGPGAKP